MKVKLAFVAIALATLALAAGALAAKPIKGATYSGKINRASNVTYPISFKVTPNGTHVTAFKVPTLPVYCQGGGFGTPQSVAAKITRTGSFKAKLPIYFAPAHSTQGNLIVTGKFAKGGKESGKVTTSFTHVTSCDGTSSYSTKG
jgi:hypothetical protein